MRYLPQFLYTVVFLGLFSTLAFSEIEPPQFNTWLKGYKEGSLELPPPKKQLDKNLQYVLVCGFLGEIGSGYFEKNKQELIDCGIPEENIHIVKLQSTNSLEQNESHLFEEVSKIAGPKVLVLHSLAGPVGVQMSVRRKEYYTNNVIATFSIQGVFGGSTLADMATTLAKWIPIPSFIPKNKFLVPVAQYIQDKAAKLTQKATSGLNSLTSKTDTKSLEEILLRDSDWMRRISPTFYFITSKAGFKETQNYRYRLTKGIMALSLDMDDIDNDGAVSTKKQKINGVGCVLTLIEGVDHSGLTSHKNGPDYVRALMRSIYTGVDSLL
jgi:hypothetical protein